MRATHKVAVGCGVCVLGAFITLTWIGPVWSSHNTQLGAKLVPVTVIQTDDGLELSSLFANAKHFSEAEARIKQLGGPKGAVCGADESSLSRVARFFMPIALAAVSCSNQLCSGTRMVDSQATCQGTSCSGTFGDAGWQANGNVLKGVHYDGTQSCPGQGCAQCNIKTCDMPPQCATNADCAACQYCSGGVCLNSACASYPCCHIASDCTGMFEGASCVSGCCSPPPCISCGSTCFIPETCSDGTLEICVTDSGGQHPGCKTGSPIILDPDGEGFHLTDLAHGVTFPTGPGQPRIQMSWTDPRYHNAWLALDRNGNGLIDDMTELFGDYTPQPKSDSPNGFNALAVYDDPAKGGNGNGRIDPRDAIYPSLRLWVDKNHRYGPEGRCIRQPVPLPVIRDRPGRGIEPSLLRRVSHPRRPIDGSLRHGRVPTSNSCRRGWAESAVKARSTPT